MANAFSFELVSPERQLLSGEAVQAIVPGVDGQFTVLQNHAAMVTTLRSGILDVEMLDGERHRIFVRGGFSDCHHNGLTVLAEQAISIADLKMGDLEQAIVDASDDVQDAQNDQTKSIAQTRLDQLNEVKVILQNEI